MVKRGQINNKVAKKNISRTATENVSCTRLILVTVKVITKNVFPNDFVCFS